MLGQKFNNLLKALDINKVTAANDLGVTKTAISDITNGRVQKLSGTIIELLKIKHNVNPAYWQGNDAPMFLSSVTTQSISPTRSNPLAELDKESRKLVEGLVHVLVQRKALIEPKGSQTVTSRIAAKSQDYPHGELREIPELGRIAAGLPTSETQRDGKVLLFPRAIIPDKGPLYALRVYGESMRDAGIHKGDYAILKPVPDPRELKRGTVVAALVDGENTLKRLYIHNGGAILRAANPDFKDIEVDKYQELVIQGQLKYLIKSWPDE